MRPREFPAESCCGQLVNDQADAASMRPREFPAESVRNLFHQAFLTLSLQ